MPIGGSLSKVKDKFYQELSRLLRNVRPPNVVSDFNAQLAYLAETESHTVKGFSFVIHRANNGDRLVEVCSDHRLYLADTIFCQESDMCSVES